MKNVSILSKLFLVSALALPCGQAFGMDIPKAAVKGAFNGIRTGLEKEGFWQWPSVNACKWGLMGVGGSAFYYGLKNLPKKKFKTIMITMGFGAFGYLLGKVALNGGKIDRGFKQTFKNQKILKNGIKNVDEKVEDSAKVQELYTEQLFGAIEKLKLDSSVLMKMNLFIMKGFVKNPTETAVQDFITKNGIEAALKKELGLDPKELLRNIRNQVMREREEIRKKEQEKKDQEKNKSGKRWYFGYFF